ncbi:SDR family NAD(P)-dependent oxidoreductase [Jatrophihabitans sp. YIM 134969]
MTTPTAADLTATDPTRPTTRTALVTGSTSGIGAATARALAREGYRVVVTGRDVDRGAAVVESIEHDGGSAVFVASDLTASPDVIRSFAADAVAAAGGRLDLLVHNAAVCIVENTVTLTDAQLETTLAVNVRAPHVLTAALVPAMAERGHGAVVVIGSWMAEVGHPFVGLYAASKAAEQELARCWAAEFGPRGVRVNTVAPGATSTPINADAADAMTALTVGIPARRTGTPDDIAAAVVWLASDASSYVHGTVLEVDGGINATHSS